MIPTLYSIPIPTLPSSQQLPSTLTNHQQQYTESILIYPLDGEHITTHGSICFIWHLSSIMLDSLQQADETNNSQFLLQHLSAMMQNGFFAIIYSNSTSIIQSVTKSTNQSTNQINSTNCLTLNDFLVTNPNHFNLQQHISSLQTQFESILQQQLNQHQQQQGQQHLSFQNNFDELYSHIFGFLGCTLASPTNNKPTIRKSSSIPILIQQFNALSPHLAHFDGNINNNNGNNNDQYQQQQNQTQAQQTNYRDEFDTMHDEKDDEVTVINKHQPQQDLQIIQTIPFQQAQQQFSSQQTNGILLFSPPAQLSAANSGRLFQPTTNTSITNDNNLKNTNVQKSSRNGNNGTVDILSHTIPPILNNINNIPNIEVDDDTIVPIISNKDNHQDILIPTIIASSPIHTPVESQSQLHTQQFSFQTARKGNNGSTTKFNKQLQQKQQLNQNDNTNQIIPTQQDSNVTQTSQPPNQSTTIIHSNDNNIDENSTPTTITTTDDDKITQMIQNALFFMHFIHTAHKTDLKLLLGILTMISPKCFQIVSDLCNEYKNTPQGQIYMQNINTDTGVNNNQDSTTSEPESIDLISLFPYLHRDQTVQEVDTVVQRPNTRSTRSTTKNATTPTPQQDKNKIKPTNDIHAPYLLLLSFLNQFHDNDFDLIFDSIITKILTTHLSQSIFNELQQLVIYIDHDHDNQSHSMNNNTSDLIESNQIQTKSKRGTKTQQNRSKRNQSTKATTSSIITTPSLSSPISFSHLMSLLSIDAMSRSQLFPTSTHLNELIQFLIHFVQLIDTTESFQAFLRKIENGITTTTTSTITKSTMSDDTSTSTKSIQEQQAQHSSDMADIDTSPHDNSTKTTSTATTFNPDSNPSPPMPLLLHIHPESIPQINTIISDHLKDTNAINIDDNLDHDQQTPQIQTILKYLNIPIDTCPQLTLLPSYFSFPLSKSIPNDIQLQLYQQFEQLSRLIGLDINSLQQQLRLKEKQLQEQQEHQQQQLQLQQQQQQQQLQLQQQHNLQPSLMPPHPSHKRHQKSIPIPSHVLDGLDSNGSQSSHSQPQSQSKSHTSSHPHSTFNSAINTPITEHADQQQQQQQQEKRLQSQPQAHKSVQSLHSVFTPNGPVFPLFSPTNINPQLPITTTQPTFVKMGSNTNIINQTIQQQLNQQQLNQQRSNVSSGQSSSTSLPVTPLGTNILGSLPNSTSQQTMINIENNPSQTTIQLPLLPSTVSLQQQNPLTTGTMISSSTIQPINLFSTKNQALTTNLKFNTNQTDSNNNSASQSMHQSSNQSSQSNISGSIAIKRTFSMLESSTNTSQSQHSQQSQTSNQLGSNKQLTTNFQNVRNLQPSSNNNSFVLPTHMLTTTASLSNNNNASTSNTNQLPTIVPTSTTAQSSISRLLVPSSPLKQPSLQASTSLTQQQQQQQQQSTSNNNSFSIKDEMLRSLNPSSQKQTTSTSSPPTPTGLGIPTILSPSRMSLTGSGISTTLNVPSNLPLNPSATNTNTIGTNTNNASTNPNNSTAGTNNMSNIPNVPSSTRHLFQSLAPTPNKILTPFGSNLPNFNSMNNFNTQNPLNNTLGTSNVTTPTPLAQQFLSIGSISNQNSLTFPFGPTSTINALRQSTSNTNSTLSSPLSGTIIHNITNQNQFNQLGSSSSSTTNQPVNAPTTIFNNNPLSQQLQSPNSFTMLNAAANRRLSLLNKQSMNKLNPPQQFFNINNNNNGMIDQQQMNNIDGNDPNEWHYDADGQIIQMNNNNNYQQNNNGQNVKKYKRAKKTLGGGMSRSGLQHQRQLNIKMNDHTSNYGAGMNYNQNSSSIKPFSQSQQHLSNIRSQYDRNDDAYRYVMLNTDQNNNTNTMNNNDINRNGQENELELYPTGDITSSDDLGSSDANINHHHNKMSPLLENDDEMEYYNQHHLKNNHHHHRLQPTTGNRYSNRTTNFNHSNNNHNDNKIPIRKTRAQSRTLSRPQPTKQRDIFVLASPSYNQQQKLKSNHYNNHDRTSTGTVLPKSLHRSKHGEITFSKPLWSLTEYNVNAKEVKPTSNPTYVRLESLQPPLFVFSIASQIYGFHVTLPTDLPPSQQQTYNQPTYDQYTTGQSTLDEHLLINDQQQIDTKPTTSRRTKKSTKGSDMNDGKKVRQSRLTSTTKGTKKSRSINSDNNTLATINNTLNGTINDKQRRIISSDSSGDETESDLDDDNDDGDNSEEYIEKKNSRNNNNQSHTTRGVSTRRKNLEQNDHSTTKITMIDDDDSDNNNQLNNDLYTNNSNMIEDTTILATNQLKQFTQVNPHATSLGAATTEKNEVINYSTFTRVDRRTKQGRHIDGIFLLAIAHDAKLQEQKIILDNNDGVLPPGITQIKNWPVNLGGSKVSKLDNDVYFEYKEKQHEELLELIKTEQDQFLIQREQEIAEFEAHKQAKLLSREQKRRSGGKTKNNFHLISDFQQYDDYDGNNNNIGYENGYDMNDSYDNTMNNNGYNQQQQYQHRTPQQPQQQHQQQLPPQQYHDFINKNYQTLPKINSLQSQQQIQNVPMTTIPLTYSEQPQSLPPVSHPLTNALLPMPIKQHQQLQQQQLQQQQPLNPLLQQQFQQQPSMNNDQIQHRMATTTTNVPLMDNQPSNQPFPILQSPPNDFNFSVGNKISMPTTTTTTNNSAINNNVSNTAFDIQQEQTANTNIPTIPLHQSNPQTSTTTTTTLSTNNPTNQIVDPSIELIQSPTTPSKSTRRTTKTPKATTNKTDTKIDNDNDNIDIKLDNKQQTPKRNTRRNTQSEQHDEDNEQQQQQQHQQPQSQPIATISTSMTIDSNLNDKNDKPKPTMNTRPRRGRANTVIDVDEKQPH